MQLSENANVVKILVDACNPCTIGSIVQEILLHTDALTAYDAEQRAMRGINELIRTGRYSLDYISDYISGNDNDPGYVVLDFAEISPMPQISSADMRLIEASRKINSGLRDAMLTHLADCGLLSFSSAVEITREYFRCGGEFTDIVMQQFKSIIDGFSRQYEVTTIERIPGVSEVAIARK